VQRKLQNSRRFFSGAGAMGPVASYAIDKWVKRPEAFLIEELRSGNIEIDWRIADNRKSGVACT
jgi:hypothetical protein